MYTFLTYFQVSQGSSSYVWPLYAAEGRGCSVTSLLNNNMKQGFLPSGPLAERVIMYDGEAHAEISVVV